MVSTPRFHHRGHEFNPWSRNKDPTCSAVRQKHFYKDFFFFLKRSKQTLFTSDTTREVVSLHLILPFPYPLNVQQIRCVLHSLSFICLSLDGARSLFCSAQTFETVLGERLQQPRAGKLHKEYVIISKCYLEKEIKRLC